MRDALSITEKLMISCEKVTVEHVMKSLCLMDSEVALQIMRSIVNGDGRQAILLLQRICEEGKIWCSWSNIYSNAVRMGSFFLHHLELQLYIIQKNIRMHCMK